MYKQQNTILQPQESSGRDVTCSYRTRTGTDWTGTLKQGIGGGGGGGLVTVQGGTG